MSFDFAALSSQLTTDRQGSRVEEYALDAGIDEAMRNDWDESIAVDNGSQLFDCITIVWSRLASSLLPFLPFIHSTRIGRMRKPIEVRRCLYMKQAAEGIEGGRIYSSDGSRYIPQTVARCTREIYSAGKTS